MDRVNKRVKPRRNDIHHKKLVDELNMWDDSGHIIFLCLGLAGFLYWEQNKINIQFVEIINPNLIQNSVLRITSNIWFREFYSDKFIQIVWEIGNLKQINSLILSNYLLQTTKIMWKQYLIENSLN